MMRTLTFLIKNRECPDKLSRWIIVWIKRIYLTIPLLKIIITATYLRNLGTSLGDLVIVGNLKLTGDKSKLHIGNQSALGRVSISLHDTVHIGRCVVINDGAILLTASHNLRDTNWSPKRGPITIGDYAWVATNAIILPGVSIGKGSVIGAGAVVRKDVPEYAVVIGNPARVHSTQRVRQLSYSPVLLNAPFEAWIGRNIETLHKESEPT